MGGFKLGLQGGRDAALGELLLQARDGGNRTGGAVQDGLTDIGGLGGDEKYADRSIGRYGREQSRSSTKVREITLQKPGVIRGGQLRGNAGCISTIFTRRVEMKGRFKDV